MGAKLQQQINNLPKTTGVYLMYEKNHLIYIGKAINIKDRVKNHFMHPSYRDNLFITKVSRVECIETKSEIEALVLEAQLIKRHLPKFNVVWKDDKNYFYIAFEENTQGVPFVYITHQPKKVSNIKYKVSGIQNTKYIIPNTQTIGPFIEGAALKKTLKYLRRVFPFYTTEKHPKTKCTWCHLGLCPGPEPDLMEYKANLKKLTHILQGKRKTVLFALRKEMQTLSHSLKYEQAAKVRNQLMALERVMEHTRVIESENLKSQNAKWPETQAMLQKVIGTSDTPISRIECYDISNIQGKFAVGSMAVFVDGAPDKSQYKKFRIRMKNEPNDIAMLKEILTRRLTHPEWGWPDVMLIDGGIAQLNVALNVKQSTINAKNVKVISIAKGRQELFIEGRKQPIPLKNLPQEIYALIKHLDDEAHRFAVSYHRRVRGRELLT